MAALAVLGAASLAAAQAEPAPLDLAAAMSRARDHAREVAAAEARQSAAEADLRQAKAYRLPQLRLSETWMRTDSPADVFGMLLNQERFSFNDFVQSDPNRPDPLASAITRVEIEMPIWTGGEISTRVAQARLASSAAASGSQRARDAAAADAAQAWIRLAQVREAVAVLKSWRDTVAAHLKLARDYAAQGMIVRSEVLRAEVELSRIEDLLAGAQGNARVAEANLAFRLAQPSESQYQLASLGDPLPLTTPLASWLAAADHRPDLQQARQRLAAGELEADAQRAALFPHIGLVARHDWVDDSLFGGHGESNSVMAMASLNLFDGGRSRAAVASARAQAEAGRADVASFSDGVRLETEHDWENARVALQRRATAAAALDAAGESVRILEQRFRAGVVKTIDVLDATTAERDARMRELVARGDAWLARVQLVLAAGLAPERALEPDPLATTDSSTSDISTPSDSGAQP